MKTSVSPIIYTKHDSITVDFGAGRSLRMNRYSESAKGAVPKTVFFAWCKVRDAKGGTLGERVEKFVKNIRRIWPAWDKAGTPKARAAKPKTVAETYGADAPRAVSMMIRDASNRYKLPPRFMEKNGPCPASVILLDRKTGKTVELGLCDLHGAKKVLEAFFG